MNDLMLKNITNFVYYEREKEWEITIHKEGKIEVQKRFTEEKGNQILLQYCLLWKCFKLEPHLDTITLKNSDEERGFVRFVSPEGVKNKGNQFLNEFVYFVFSLFQNGNNVIIEKNFYYGNQIHFYRKMAEENMQSVGFEISENLHTIPYIIKEYLEHHSVENIEMKNDIVYINNLTLNKSLLTKGKNSVIDNFLREKSNSLLLKKSEENE